MDPCTIFPAHWCVASFHTWAEDCWSGLAQPMLVPGGGLGPVTQSGHDECQVAWCEDSTEVVYCRWYRGPTCFFGADTMFLIWNWLRCLMDPVAKNKQLLMENGMKQLTHIDVPDVGYAITTAFLIPPGGSALSCWTFIGSWLFWQLSQLRKEKLQDNVGIWEIANEPKISGKNAAFHICSGCSAPRA